MGRAIEAVLVVVPARDEEVLLPRCLAALSAAARQARTTGVAVRTVVVANRCSDATADIAAAGGVDVLVNDADNVGQARAGGCEWSRVAFPGVDTHRLWFATTDADSRVPEQWLLAHLSAAQQGADAFAGTVALSPPDAARHHQWAAAYRRGIGGSGHRHAHGANLGVRADAYARVGGFADLECGEDEVLLACLSAHRAPIAWSAADPVMTSARRLARAPRGVSADLHRSARARPRAIDRAALPAGRLA